jgi:hypothetical protein
VWFVSAVRPELMHLGEPPGDVIWGCVPRLVWPCLVASGIAPENPLYVCSAGASCTPSLAVSAVCFRYCIHVLLVLPVTVW